MNMRCFIASLLIFFGFLAIQNLKAENRYILFKSGDCGYNTYRIPAVAVCGNGDILVFAEARKHSASDSGAIDLVMRRSQDRGKTWSPIQIVADGKGNTCGNPAPVVLKDSNELLLIYNWALSDDTEQKILQKKAKDQRRTFVIRSSDNGLRWSEPMDITTQVKTPMQTWFATGPSGVIQIEGGRFDGRIVCPVATAVGFPHRYMATSFYSDDGGYNWSRGEFVNCDGTNESQIAQLDSDTLCINMRLQTLNSDGSRKSLNRLISISKDGGKTWQNVLSDKELIEPICQGAFISFKYNGERKVAFSNPADTKKRKNMTLRLSDANGYIEAYKCGFEKSKVWEKSISVDKGYSGYSDLDCIKDEDIIIVYEGGGKIIFKKYALETLFNK